MRALFGAAGLLVMVLVIGCEQAKPPVVPTPAPPPVTKVDEPLGDPPAQPQADPSLAEMEPDSAAQPTDAEAAETTDEELSPKHEAELKARVEKDPKDSKAFLALARLTQLNGSNTLVRAPDYGLLKQSVEYLQKALEADPKIVEEATFQELAPQIFYNGACALSRDKQVEPALKALSSSIEHGWWNLKAINADPDLASVREDKGFAALVDSFRQKRRAQIAPEVDALFAASHKFSFDFDLKDTDGNPIKKDDFKGKLLLANVWGTWCGPCRAEIPDLAAAYDKYKSQGFEIVGLNTESSEGDEANKLIKENQKSLGINYRCALGNDKVFQQIPQYGAVPTSLFMDREGKVRVMLVGSVDDIMLDSIIERLIKESPEGTK